jgi:hypothetical protein
MKEGRSAFKVFTGKPIGKGALRKAKAYMGGQY